MLYPLKFRPIVKDRIWGGRNLETRYAKKNPRKLRLGECWELSGVEGDQSVVAEGVLKGNTIGELIEVYMGDLVGDAVYERFGDEMPLLVKLIDTDQMLSVQVHPSDELAAARHGAYGKTEMWYVAHHAPGAYIYVGFNRPVSREEYILYLNEGRIEELLQKYYVAKGDVYFIPAGTVHAIGAGVTVVEIQQTSDVTYRIYDFGRVDSNGVPRELHTDLALDAIDFSSGVDPKIDIATVNEGSVDIQSCPYFSSAFTRVPGRLERDYSRLDSFVVYVCVEGKARVACDGFNTTLCEGETLFIPAVMDVVEIEGEADIIEAWIV